MIDFPLNLRDDKESWAWYWGSKWLSLDRFERFWLDVGLTLSNGEAVKAAVRAALRVEFADRAEWRARYAANPDAPEDPNETDPTEALAKTFFRTIKETAGAYDADCVAAWLTGPVLAAEKEAKWHNTWSELLYCLAEEASSTLTSLYGVPEDTARTIVKIAVHFKNEVDTMKERVEAADQEPLSGWDAVAYADYRWENQELSPLDGLGLHLRYICFDRTWSEVVRCTRPSDIDALIHWGSAFLRARNRPYDATIPDDVRAAWHQAWRN